MTSTQNQNKGNTKAGKQSRHMSDSMKKNDSKRKNATGRSDVGSNQLSSNAGAGTQSDNNNQ